MDEEILILGGLHTFVFDQADVHGFLAEFLNLFKSLTNKEASLPGN